MANRDLLLETILHYVPKMERKNVIEQYSFFTEEIKDRISKGKKFILEYEDLKTLVSVILLYRLVIAPLKHSGDFFNRMKEQGVSFVVLGRYSLDDKKNEKNKQIVSHFYGMLKDFFEKKNIEGWEKILEIETTLDFEQILGVK